MENLTNISVIKDIFERHGFTFSKALGQNFIVNPSVCPKIAEMGNAKAGFGVIEIGTGVGVLTHELAKRADKVVAVEIDSRLIPILDETLSEHNNVKIINADVMQTDLKKVIEENLSGLDVAVTAAVNYYAKPSLLFNVSRGNFMPAPNVDSCVIRLDILDTPPVEVSDEKYFFKVVRGSFSQRRKNLANSLSSAMGMEKATVINAIRAA